MEVRKLVKYSNRKIYDTYNKGYTTIEKITKYVNDGGDVQVIDHKTNKDITINVLSVALANKLKTNPEISADYLAELVRNV